MGLVWLSTQDYHIVCFSFYRVDLINSDYNTRHYTVMQLHHKNIFLFFTYTLQFKSINVSICGQVTGELCYNAY